MYQIAYHRQKYNDNGDKIGLNPYPSYRCMKQFTTRDEASEAPEFTQQEDNGKTYFPRIWNEDELSKY